MPDFIPPEYEKLVNIIFLVVTALIAHHGITYRNPDGEKDFVRLANLLPTVYYLEIEAKLIEAKDSFDDLLLKAAKITR